MVIYTSDRGDDKGSTSTRIRYPSPPRRENDDLLRLLTKDRGMGRFQPRYTPPDICAAQDVALNIADRRNFTIAAPPPAPTRTDSAAPPAKKTMQYIPAPKRDGDEYAVKAPPTFPPPPLAPKIRLSAPSSHSLPARAASPAPSMRLSAPSSHSLAARAASPKRTFSNISSLGALPDEQPVKMSTQPPRRERKGKGRIGNVRASELANLAVNAEGLDPIRQEPRVRMEYLSKGKWYEVTGGRPSWAEDERERVVAVGGQTTRRTRVSPGKYAQ